MIIYSDESCDENKRFHSITGIYGTKESLERLNQDIKIILDKYSLNEIKYNKISNLNKNFNAFKEVINLIGLHIASKKVSIGTIVRDRFDSRRQIKGINHERDFERMYYLLLKIIIKKNNSPTKSRICCADEKGGCRWSEIENYLNLTKSMKKEFSNKKRLFQEIDNITGKEKIVISIQECLSSATPLIQMADLLAGFICFSRTNYERYYEKGLHFHKWLETKEHYNNSKNSLFSQEKSLLCYEKLASIENSISNNDKKRYYAKEYLVNKFKEYKLGLSIGTKGYIAAEHGKKGFYILHYDPQSTNDKAPTN